MLGFRATLFVAFLVLVGAAVLSPALAQIPEDIFRKLKQIAPKDLLDKVERAKERERSRDRQRFDRTDSPAEGGDPDERLVIQMQYALLEAGHHIGRPDGVWGPKAREATKKIQSSIGHPLTGWLTASQLAYLQQRNAGARPASPRLDPKEPVFDDEQRTIRMQVALARAGFSIGQPDGRWGNTARQAAREYQMRLGHPATGRLNDSQLALLEGQIAPSQPSASVAIDSGIATQTGPFGVWKGVYLCRQGLTGVTLSFDHPGDAKGTARFMFYPAPGGPNIPDGVILYRWTFAPASRQLDLNGLRWIKQPATYQIIEIRGHLNAAATEFNGQVLASGCGNITLKKEDQLPAAAVTSRLEASPGVGRSTAKPHEVVAIKPVEAAKVTANVGDYEVAYQFTAPKGCSGPLTVKFTSPVERFFGNDQSLIRALVPDIASYAQSNCANATTLRIEGFLGQGTVYEGEIVQVGGCTLRSLLTPLDLARRYMKNFPMELSSLAPLMAHLAAHEERFGGKESTDWQALNRETSDLAGEIASQGFASFSAMLSALPLSIDGLDRLESTTAKSLALLAHAAPSHLPRYQEAVDARARDIRSGIVAAISSELQVQVPTWQSAVLQISLAQLRLTQLRDRVPEAASAAQAAIAQRRRDIEIGRSAFTANLQAEPTDWGSLQSLSDVRSRLVEQTKHASELEAYVNAVDARRESMLKALQEQAVQEIATKGTGMTDLEGVLDRGEALAANFRKANAEVAVRDVQAATASRVDGLVRANLPAFRESVAKAAVTAAVLEDLGKLLLEYSELELSVPAFAEYRQALATRIGEIDRTLCTQAHSRAGLGSSVAARKVVIEDEVISLGDFACAADRVGHAFSKFETSWFNSKVWTHYRGSNGQELAVELAPSDEAADAKALVGIAVKRVGNRHELSRQEWIELSQEMLRAPPTGKADAKGATECDTLAADPADPKKLADGVAQENIASARALEACIAALEQDPANARLRFQLGRALLAAGAEKEAKAHLEKAAIDGHAASSAALGDLLFLEEATEKDALEHYSKALSGGYQAAADKVTALSVAEFIDLSQGWPARGTVKLQCFTEVTGFNALNEPEFFEADVLMVSLNLGARSATFDHQIVAFHGNPLVARGNFHSYSDNGGTLDIRVEPIGRMTTNAVLSLNKNSLELSHRQGLQLTNFFGQPVPGVLEVTASCVQDF